MKNLLLPFVSFMGNVPAKDLLPNLPKLEPVDFPWYIYLIRNIIAFGIDFTKEAFNVTFEILDPIFQDLINFPLTKYAADVQLRIIEFVYNKDLSFTEAFGDLPQYLKTQLSHDIDTFLHIIPTIFKF